MSSVRADAKVIQIWWETTAKSLESLPVELQRNFKLMRDLDSRAEGVMQDIDRLGDEFLRAASTASAEKKRELQAKITKLFNKAKEYGDDKVQLAIQTYELVDKHIRRLDSDLARFESEIKNGTSGAGPSSPNTDTGTTEKKKGRKREKEVFKKSKVETDDKASKGGSASPARKKHKSEIQIVAEQAASTSGTQDASLDMPVDPNEPTYCICHQVSYGQMIACDNSECTIEWFHIGCMGLQSIPKGKWYCPKCQPIRKK